MIQVDKEKMKFFDRKALQVKACWIDPNYSLPPEKDGLLIVAYFIEKIDEGDVHIPIVLIYLDEFSSWIQYLSNDNQMLDIKQCIAWMPIAAIEPQTSEHISGSLYNFC